MLGRLDNSSGGPHLAPIAVGMAEALMRAVEVEAVQELGYRRQPGHGLLQPVRFIWHIVQGAGRRLLLLGEDLGVLGTCGRLGSLVVGGLRGRDGGYFPSSGC